MIFFVLISILLITISAVPITEDAQATILQQENINLGDGNYQFSFETSNGLRRSETGILLNRGQPNEYQRVQGVYSYIDQEGNTVDVHYTADENGYHIDVPPQIVGAGPVPPAVVASLLGG